MKSLPEEEARLEFKNIPKELREGRSPCLSPLITILRKKRVAEEEEEWTGEKKKKRRKERALSLSQRKRINPSPTCDPFHARPLDFIGPPHTLSEANECSGNATFSNQAEIINCFTPTKILLHSLHPDPCIFVSIILTKGS